jgi:hypothetical protein
LLDIYEQGGVMLLKSTLQSFRLALVAAAVAVVFGTSVCASGYKCNCEPSTAVYHSPFFGYYRTCWRTWPGGQPSCPAHPTPEAAEANAPATKERTIEQLPLPRPEPEEPEKKP